MTEHNDRHAGTPGHEEQRSHYGRLLLMSLLSFGAMYLLMYAMVDDLANVYPNVNQFYMAGLMTAPMVAFEVLLMRGMYRSRTVNGIILASSGLALVLLFALIREQGVVGDRQFLRSMIPHHASAILMCEEAKLRDPELQALCDEIVAGQQQEIDQMKTKLAEMRR